ncbi:MAG TPA: hypothetical protein VF717_05975 [Pyrinomonadaceae bacterium]|jgi:hypothetical protein
MSQNGRVDEIALIQSWLEEAEREYEAAQRELQRLEALVQDKGAEVNGYRKALEARRRRLASINPSENTQTVGENKAELKDDFIYQLPTAIDQMIYIVRKNDSEGITPPEILSAFRKAGLPIRNNYLYTALGRMLEKGRLKKVGYKYYLSEREKARTASDQSLLEPNH